MRFTPRKLFLISLSILFLELASIRWLNASVEVLAYFNNFILISCFFGLGLGCLLARRRIHLIRLFSPALLALVLGALLLKDHGVSVSYSEDYIFAARQFQDPSGALWVSLAALSGFFINVLLFVILGQELGRQLAAVPHPLVAYAYDIAGSLAGVLLYALLAYLRTPPVVWYGAGCLVLLFFVADRWWRLAASGMAVAAALIIVANADPGARWSPYYKVETKPILNREGVGVGSQIEVDNFRIQDALEFGPALEKAAHRAWVPYYELPYHIIRPRSVLILGAGAGNESVLALRHGAMEIHAVEIDPVIAGFGRHLHPHRPYLDDRVTVIVDDARAFISRASRKYDLVLLSALDSHKQIAGMSSLRLESFVYTVEAFARMKDLVAEGGVFCLNVSSPRPWIGERVYWSLTEAFGAEPETIVSRGIAACSMAYVYAPPDLLKRDLLPDRPPLTVLDPPPERGEVTLATDDWPHLYMEAPGIPRLYWVILGAMVLSSTLLVVAVEPAVRRPNLHFFFLGAGFMLLETRSVTQMALLFGSTWHVNTVVFASILLAIFVTNLLVLKGWSPSRRIAYILLLLTLLGGTVFPFHSLLGLALPLRIAAAGLAVGLPIAWASFIFSTSFRDATDVGSVFGSNLLGVVAGGCLEYVSQMAGLGVLFAVAGALYLASAAAAPALTSRYGKA